MTSRTKRKAARPTGTAEKESEQDSDAYIPRPALPRPNKRLLQLSAILLVIWFGFLAWMALFS